MSSFLVGPLMFASYKSKHFGALLPITHLVEEVQHNAQQPVFIFRSLDKTRRAK
jgi:hypothetical protein